MSIYSYSVTKPNGEELSLSEFKGKVMLIVNTATGCGFTPHYEPLEKVYEELHDKGLEIIDVPCNQFANQTPGTDEEIHQFCTLHYNTQFPQMKKSDVNGENALPLYTYLKQQQGFGGFGEGKMATLLNDMLGKLNPKFMENPDIKWNFTKFVVDREGNVVARFEPTASMDKVEECVRKLI